MGMSKSEFKERNIQKGLIQHRPHVPRTVVRAKEPELKKDTKGPDRKPNVVGFDLLGHNGPAPELTVLPIASIEIGDQILPVDATTVEALKQVFLIDRQVVPVQIRKHGDGRHELISGHADICALRELGRTDVLAMVVSGLSDLDARFLEIANNIHPKLPVLDRALLHARLKVVMREQQRLNMRQILSLITELSLRRMAGPFRCKKRCSSALEENRRHRCGSSPTHSRSKSPRQSKCASGILHAPEKPR